MSAFYDFNTTYGNMTERPVTVLETSTVSISNIFQLDDLNCSTIYMPYCGKLPIPDVLLTDEEKTTALYENEETTTARIPGRQILYMRLISSCYSHSYGHLVISLSTIRAEHRLM